MARTELPDNRRIILTTLVGIADQQCNRSARGTAFVDAGENLDFIGPHAAPRYDGSYR